MNILIACDKFRGSLNGLEAIEAIKSGLNSVNNSNIIQTAVLADGGEGTFELLSAHFECSDLPVEVKNAIGNSISSSIGINRTEKVAVLEMAKYVGLAQLSEDQRDPLSTSSYGLGQALMKAINEGARTIYLGIGGSATNDGGAGLLAALGFEFRSEGRKIEPNGGNLSEIEEIVSPKLKVWKNVKIIIASDVNNPLLGPKGATYTYAEQKGALTEDFEVLEAGMTHFASHVEKVTGNVVTDKNGYGAAGGVPLSLCELLGAEISTGSQLLFDLQNLDDKIENTDLVIAGEGKIDHQTGNGKAIYPVVEAALKKNKKVILVCGILDERASKELKTLTSFQLVEEAKDLGLDSFKDAKELCFSIGKKIGDQYFY